MKKFIVILVAIISLSCSMYVLKVEAQWVNHPIEYGEEVRSIISKGNKMFAGTYILGVCVSTNGGYNWSLCQDMSIMKVSSFLVKGNNIYGGGENGRFYVTTNDGINWTTIHINIMTDFNCIYESGNYFLGGTIHSLIRSSNSGENWITTSINQPTYCISPNNGKVIAGTLDGIYETTDDGSTWSKFGTFYAVRAAARTGNNILAATGYDGVYYTTNQGINWIRTSLTTLKVFNFIVSDNKVYAGTDSGVYVSTNYGINWVSQNYGIPVPRIVLSTYIYNNRIYIGTNGESIWSRPISELTGVETINTEIPSSYSLGQNYPNPFNPSTVVRFQLSVVSNVVLKVYDVTGREVQTLVNERLNAGTYEVRFDGSMLNSGVYFYRMVTEGFTETKRMLMIK